MALTRVRQTAIAMALSGMAVFAGVLAGQAMQASAQDMATAPSFKNTKWAMTVTWVKNSPIKGDLLLKEGGAASFTYDEGKKHLDGTWSGSAMGDLRMSFNAGGLDYSGKRDGDNLNGKILNNMTKAKG
ncbi:MAG TPA: hypothetical protein VG942_10095, partial [Hyphomonadaceae bacterium]|nr:hypothetical protein [Hyphomonadaceae bacterium]